MKENNLILYPKSTKLAIQAPPELLYTENENERRIHMGKKKKDGVSWRAFIFIMPDIQEQNLQRICPVVQTTEIALFNKSLFYKCELAFSLSPFTTENTEEKERGRGKGKRNVWKFEEKNINAYILFQK